MAFTDLAPCETYVKKSAAPTEIASAPSHPSELQALKEPHSMLEYVALKNAKPTSASGENALHPTAEVYEALLPHTSDQAPSILQATWTSLMKVLLWCSS